MLYPKLAENILTIVGEFKNIAPERKKNLESIAQYIESKKDDEIINFIFICTHNSRRSHFTQIWAQVAAQYHGLKNFQSYSGGIETTALYPSVKESLKKCGFSILMLSDGINPVYSIKYDTNQHPVMGFSKIYNDVFNPKNDFVAVMTCSHADLNCPYIPDAAIRFSLPYNDPKAFDGQDNEEEKYLEKSIEIGREMFYLFSKIKK